MDARFRIVGQKRQFALTPFAKSSYSVALFPFMKTTNPRLAFLVIVLAVGAIATSHAATWTNFNAAATLRWGDNLNWSPNTFPTSLDSSAVADFQVSLPT